MRSQTTHWEMPLPGGPTPSILTRVTDTTWFWIVFPITLALLIGALWTGSRGIRRVHLILAPVSLVFLGVAILLAVRMGQTRNFPPDEMRIHRMFATSAALLALPVIASGLALFRSPRWRRVHRVCVILFFFTALVATGTGVWVFTMSTPK